ncbi:MAG: RodZ domain-containing protein [Nitrospirota bacterium]
MDTPGKLLKAEREKQQKSLEELANALRIRQDFLEAVENGNYGIIPGEVFVKGYIRAYADYLGLNSNHVLRLYKKQVAKVSSAESKADISNKRKFPVYKAVLIFAGSILIAVFLFILINRKDEAPVVQSVTEPLVEQPEVIEEPKIIPEEKQEGNNLKITATELTWVSVAADRGEPMERLLNTGEVVSLTAVKSFSVKIGNAAGVRLVFNGQSMGELGSPGEVVNLTLPNSADVNAREGGRQN